mgnify:CR=1 FL=1
MKKRFNLCRFAVSAVLITVMFFCLLAVVSADSEVTAADVLNSSVVLKMKTPFYLKGGEKVYYTDDRYYYPQYKNDVMMVPLPSLCSMFDCTYRYDADKEEASVEKDGSVYTVRAGADGIYADGKAAKYLENPAVNTGKELLVPFDGMAEALGYRIIRLNYNDFIIAAKYDESAFTDGVKSALASAMVNDDRVILSEDFNGEPKWSVVAAWGGSGEGYNSTDCGKGAQDRAAYLGATQRSFYNLMSSNVTYNHAKEYRVTFDAKVTEDWANLALYPTIWLYDGKGKFIGMINFLTTCNMQPSTEWKTFTYALPKYYIKGGEYDNAASFQLAMRLGCLKTNEASGGIYIDNVRIEENTLPTADVECDFVADKFASWYYPGEKVKYTCKNPDALNGYNRVNITVYDSEKNVIYTDSRTAEEIKSDGWTYLPEELGYYEAEFNAVSSDGTVRKLVKGYTKTIKYDEDGRPVYAYLSQPTSHFAVVEGPAKPMEQRNEMHLASVTPYQSGETEFRLLDMIGISGLRLHYILWGNNYGGAGGIEDKPGVYNFDSADRWIKYSDKYGFKTVMANFFSTPIWAVEEKWRDVDNMTSFGYMYQKMAPENMEDLAEAIQEFYRHYKGKVDILEFMNEPAYGNTAFWADTPEKLAEMTKTAYNALRRVDPNKNMLMASASWNQGYALYNELISSDREFYDSFDIFSFHSRYAGDLKNYRNAEAKNGLESKTAAATEEYLYSAYWAGQTKNHDISTMHYYACCFNHIKKGIKYVTMFEVQDNVPDEVRHAHNLAKVGASHTIGLFTSFPYVEPHKGAPAVYNLYQNIGLDFTYAGEFDFGDGQKAVYFMSDGEPVVYVWNSDEKPFYLSGTLKAALGENAECHDFMGREFDINGEMHAMTMYCIKGFDKEKIDAIEKNEGKVLNDDFEREYYTCKMPEFIPVDEVVLDENFDGVVIDNPDSAPFDKETFELSDNINWVTDNWNWVTQNHAKPADYNAKFAAYADSDGFYLVVDVDDSAIYQQDPVNEWAENTWMNDSLQFAFDCYGTGDASMRAEFQVGIFKDKPLLYKHAAPEISFAMVDGWHESNSQLDADKYLRIENTGKGLLYKVFIPMSEMYPFQYSKNTDHLRFAVLVNDNDGTGRSYYEWTSGIGGNKDPKQFGALKFKK